MPPYGLSAESFGDKITVRLAAQVLLCDSMYVKEGPGDNRAPLNSVETLPAGHRLAMEGLAKDSEGNVLAEITNS